MKKREKRRWCRLRGASAYNATSGDTAAGNHYVSTFSALRFAKNLRRSVRRPNFFTLLFRQPFNKNGFKFFRGINALLNQQAVHGINRSHKTFVSARRFQSFVTTHICASGQLSRWSEEPQKCACAITAFFSLRPGTVINWSNDAHDGTNDAGSAGSG